METLDRVETGEETIHLLSSMRDKVAEICAKEGATLNEFVNVAVAEKLEHYAHLEWLKRRKAPTPEGVAEALKILRRAGGDNPPEPGDELPEGWSYPVHSE